MSTTSTVPAHLSGRVPSDDPADGYHHIEEAVRVYLCANPSGTGWRICHSTLDGGLPSDYDTGPLQESCECGTDEAPDPTCDLWHAHLQKQWLPDAHELLAQLADALGYTLVPPATIDQAATDPAH